MSERPTSVFPAQIDNSLLQAPNASPSFVPAGRLSVGVSPTDTTLRVVGIDLTKVPAQGLVTIGEELVRYTSLDPALQELYIDRATLRGYNGTVASAHTAGAEVLWMLTNEHLQSIHAAIEATQRKLGVDGSTDPDSIQYQLTALQAGVTAGDLRQVVIEIDQQHVDAKSLQLPEAVKDTAGVAVFVVNGGVQENGVDYTASGTDPAVLSWAGMSLDGLLASGDKLLVIYERKQL